MLVLLAGYPKRSNMPDKPDKSLLFADCEGRRHRIQIWLGASGWAFRIFEGARIVGRLDATATSTELHVGDLLVHDGTAAVRRELGGFASRFCRWLKLPERNWRERGLGAAMLEAAIAEARLHEMIRIHGIVVEDPEDRLKRFYMRHGFTIIPPDDQPIHRAMYGISMNL